MVVLDVGEDHPKWPSLRTLVQRWKVSDSTRSEFTKSEIATARWLDLIPGWHHGYPQPDELDFGYRNATYDLTDWCEKCGIGMKQKAPFQMKGEPKWGRKGILQLNWVFDEYFVRSEVWSSVFKPRGVGCRRVLDGKGDELLTVVQLVIEEEVGIVTEELPVERCTQCGRAKYLPITRGFFPALETEPTRPMVKTREYFGSGASAYRGVLASQELASAMIREDVRGVSFKPVESARRAP
jgi:hypothetical protein